MSGEVARFQVFLDAGVPDSVGMAFQSRGHAVILHRDVLPEGTPDTQVALSALASAAILVALDRDMRQLAQRYGISQGTDRLARLSLIRLGCNEALAAKRVELAMSLIEHEWAISQEKAARRMWIDIGPHYLRSNR